MNYMRLHLNYSVAIVVDHYWRCYTSTLDTHCQILCDEDKNRSKRKTTKKKFMREMNLHTLACCAWQRERSEWMERKASGKCRCLSICNSTSSVCAVSFQMRKHQWKSQMPKQCCGSRWLALCVTHDSNDLLKTKRISLEHDGNCICVQLHACAPLIYSRTNWANEMKCAICILHTDIRQMQIAETSALAQRDDDVAQHRPNANNKMNWRSTVVAG